MRWYPGQPVRGMVLGFVAANLRPVGKHEKSPKWSPGGDLEGIVPPRKNE